MKSVNHSFFVLAGIKGFMAMMLLAAPATGMAQTPSAGKGDLPVVVTRRSTIAGLGPEAAVMRRDPSDVIKVGALYYVWYSRGRFTHGYDASIWYATSPDGYTWTERGEALPRGPVGRWDEQSVFTPNILVAEGKYWLFFTAVPKPFVAKGPDLTRTAIGVSVADSPDGPWKKMDTPILLPRGDEKYFDGVRVDDSCLLVKHGRYYLYYKGRQAIVTTPYQTKMGLAIADKPQGPYQRVQDAPVIEGGHEVLVWPQGAGIAALISNHGPENIKNRIFYAEDAIHFAPSHRVENTPSGAGGYRPEAFSNSNKGQPLEWGLLIVQGKSPLPYLERFDLQWPAP